MAPLLTEECSACCLTFALSFFCTAKQGKRTEITASLKNEEMLPMICQLHDKTGYAEETLPAFQLLLFDRYAEITHRKSRAA